MITITINLKGALLAIRCFLGVHWKNCIWTEGRESYLQKSRRVSRHVCEDCGRTLSTTIGEWFLPEKVREPGFSRLKAVVK